MWGTSRNSSAQLSRFRTADSALVSLGSSRYLLSQGPPNSVASSKITSDWFRLSPRTRGEDEGEGDRQQGQRSNCPQASAPTADGDGDDTAFPGEYCAVAVMVLRSRNENIDCEIARSAFSRDCGSGQSAQHLEVRSSSGMSHARNPAQCERTTPVPLESHAGSGYRFRAASCRSLLE
mgnify:CR=1 FL=1